MLQVVVESPDRAAEYKGSRRASVAPTETSNCGVVHSNSRDDVIGGGDGVTGEGTSETDD